MSKCDSSVEAVQAEVAKHHDDIVKFLRDICAIPSMNSQLKDVGERIKAEMDKLGFDKTWFDSMGNIVGEIGEGPRTIVFDSHIDTVGVGDPAEWKWDPFQGKVEDGVLYARGACDEKGSTPGMVYGLAIAKRLGLLEGWKAYYFGNMEEWCDGIAPNALVEHEGVKPDFVVIGEPTKMQVYRGHKGRIEMEIIAKGRSAHAASNHLGDNAVYKMLPVIEGISKLEPELGDHEFLGHGKITVSDVKVETPSINAVPDECRVYVDRRGIDLVGEFLSRLVSCVTCYNHTVFVNNNRHLEPEFFNAVGNILYSFIVFPRVLFVWRYFCYAFLNYLQNQIPFKIGYFSTK